MLDRDDAMRIVKADLANLRSQAPPKIKDVSVSVLLIVTCV